MIEKIATFYILVFFALVVLRLMKPNVITFIAFTWFLPIPEKGELLSSYKARRIRYAFIWVIKFSVYFSLLIVLGAYFKKYIVETFFLVASFIGIMGIGIATNAFLVFLISWFKTVTIGPNPNFE